MTSVSVIVPTMGKNEYLEYTLASLVRQTHRDFEVIVVNDGGNPSTEDLAATYGKHFELTYLMREHGGRSIARNHGLRAATGQRVVFMDDDRIAVPDLLARHAAHDDRTVTIGWKRRAVTVWKKDGALAATDSDLRLIQERFADHLAQDAPGDQRLISVDALVDDFDAAAKLIDLGDERDNHRDIVHIFSPELDGFDIPWSLVTTGNLSASRAALVEIGGFDEGYVGWGIEDVDLGYRLHNLGLRTIVDLDAVSLHQMHPQGQTAAAVAVRRRGAESLRNVQYFCHTHGTLEAYLYWQVLTHKYSLLQANHLLREIRAIGSDTVRAEILRLYATTLPPAPSGMPVRGVNLDCAVQPFASAN